jgi:heme-degrading monooxygenase HmoA
VIAWKQRGDIMKARVVTVQIQPDKLDEAVSIYRDSVMPAASEYKGCHAIFLVTDRSSGKGVSISFWDEQELQSSEASGYLQEQFGKFAGVFAAPPTRELYDVAVWERAPSNPTHVRLMTLQTKPGTLSAGIDQYRNEVLPIMRQQPGFLGATNFVDSTTGKALSLTAWASEAEMLAGQVSGGYLDQMRDSLRLGENLAAPPIRENFEVAARWVRQS